MALPTLWDCSRRESEAELRAEVLLVEDELPICLATLLPELLVEDDVPLTDEEELLVEEDLAEEEVPLTDEDDLVEDELLVAEEPVVRLLS